MSFSQFPLGPPQLVSRKELPWVPALVSALLLAFAFAGLWPLVFVALVPWLLSLRDATPRQAWNRGYAFGLLFSLTQLWWLGDLAYKWTGSVLLGVVPWLLASLLSAVYYGLLGRIVRSCYALNAVWAIPLVWAGMEVFRSYIPVFAFPWALLGEPLVGVGTFLGWFGTIYLASAFVVAVNLVPLWPRRRWAHGIGLFVGTYALWNVWIMNSRPWIQTKTVHRTVLAAGQPGVDMAYDREADAELPSAIEALEREAAARGVDLLVLPEGVAPHAGAAIPPVTGFPIPTSPALVFGGQRGTGPIYQSAFAHDARGWTYADKTRLVIFGEFVPGRDFLPFLAAFDLPTGDLSAGDRLSTLRAGRRTVGPLLCFEALFPDLALRQAYAGSDVLAVMSIDDWFHPWARARLADASRWRAAEAGLPLVRAGSLGKSMILTPEGEPLATTPYGHRGLVVAPIMPRRGPFPLVWLFPLVAFGSLIGVPLLARRTEARTRSV